MLEKNKILKRSSTNLRRLRNEKNYTQMEVCINTGIDRSLYQKYESNNPPDIRLSNLVKLLEFFKVRLEGLLG